MDLTTPLDLAAMRESLAASDCVIVHSQDADAPIDYHKDVDSVVGLQIAGNGRVLVPLNGTPLAVDDRPNDLEFEILKRSIVLEEESSRISNPAHRWSAKKAHLNIVGHCCMHGLGVGLKVRRIQSLHYGPNDGLLPGSHGSSRLSDGGTSASTSEPQLRAAGCESPHGLTNA